ncbi:telomeric repeat binding factor a [Salminus brasiliensis]|uniref:telomeric repeat binding factor a n=1 Tax=Salminus brasiliensis TaxID=930266 RepID=UPI003B8318BC
MATQLRLEASINTWVLELYVSKAIEAFRNEEYGSFAQLRNLIEALVVRPINDRSDVTIKLRFMQFLSQINDGDKLDITYQSALTPLESALTTLEKICSETDVSQNVLEQVHTSVREMLIIICIKNEHFEKAKVMLLKHFPKGRDSAGKKKLFEDLIKWRCSTHSMIKSASYNDFKQDMLDFIEKLYKLQEPFLIKVAKLAEQGQIRTSIDGEVSRKSQTVRTADDQPSTQGRTVQNAQLPSEQTAAEDHCPLNSEQRAPAENGYSHAQPISSPVPVQLSLNKLRTIFLDLAELFLVSTPFSRVQEEVDKEAAEQESGIDLETDELGLRLSETPVEALLCEAAVKERAGKERVSEGGGRLVQQVQESPMDLTLLMDINMETAGSHSGSILTSYQVRDVISTGPENVHPTASTKQNSKTRPGGAASEVTVAQLVMEDDSQPSELEAVDSQQTPSPLKAGCSEDDPLDSLPTNSTPVRKIRRSASSRKSIPSEPEPASPQQPTEPQNCSTPTRVASPSSSSSNCTPGGHNKRTKKRQQAAFESGSDESIVIDSPPSTKKSPSKVRRNWMDVSGIPEQWSDEESLFGASTSARGRGSSVDGQGKRKMWTDEESDWVRQGVARYGEGRWERIRSMFPFKGRTAVNIKDRWRTMKKLNMV